MRVQYDTLLSVCENILKTHKSAFSSFHYSYLSVFVNIRYQLHTTFSI